MGEVVDAELPRDWFDGGRSHTSANPRSSVNGRVGEMIVDTDILIEMMRSQLDYRIERWMNEQPIQPSTTAVAVAEILAGVELIDEKIRRATVQRIFRRIREEDFAYRVIPFDEDAADVFGHLMMAYGQQGDLHVIDMQVAAIALHKRETLATRRCEVFERLGVDVCNPLGVRRAGTNGRRQEPDEKFVRLEG
ncbi:PIN domain-containing protein [Arthrobacter sp. H14]|uniref:PIN domain-containing protein n=1 Tax=Arthrobacter sp. H14 TaxID=1312959 RepID=UPI0009DE8E5C|nr:PIN domain-containing protein [Arthrobacter sp. H14]